jgi:hypothetical protein
MGMETDSVSTTIHHQPHDQRLTRQQLEYYSQIVDIHIHLLKD